VSETRKLAAILVADIVGYSRLAGADEDRILARLRTLRSDLIDPTIAVHHGRIIKRTGDGSVIEFRSVVDAVNCAIEVQRAMVERNAGVTTERRTEFRVGIHVGDVVEESDGDLMGDGVNIAARLEGVCDPGQVCLSSAAYEQVRDRVRETLVDLGEKLLKNIARPVRAYSLILDQSGAKSEQGTSETSSRLSRPDKPSIAVLPFQNMSGDLEQEYFADGIVEDIITGLSRIKWLFVIARNSSFIYKGKAVDVRQVGRDLGVRYVLEGGVRKAGGRLRLSAQLVEAETGGHLWADKYDGTLEDVFELQDRITDRVVGILEPSLRRSEIERSRRKRPDSLDAYDLFLRALPHMGTRMPDAARKAIPLLEEALRLEPDYPAAHAHLAWCREMCFTRGGFDEADKQAALFHARTVIAGNTDDSSALAMAGLVVGLLARQHDVALSATDRALALNSSCATSLYLAAMVKTVANRASDVPTLADRALRLSPFDPLALEAHQAKALIAIGQANYDEAVPCYSRVAEINPRYSTGYFAHAIALALAGRREEAEQPLKRGLELEPSFRVRFFSELGMAPTIADRLAQGARLLGLPE
jgi:TolB-like protein/class 3 adenylate cyclase